MPTLAPRGRVERAIASHTASGTRCQPAALWPSRASRTPRCRPAGPAETPRRPPGDLDPEKVPSVPPPRAARPVCPLGVRPACGPGQGPARPRFGRPAASGQQGVSKVEQRDSVPKWRDVSVTVSPGCVSLRGRAAPPRPALITAIHALPIDPGPRNDKATRRVPPNGTTRRLENT